ncbi:MAG: diacylglycerol kinase [Aggregatilineales bacterium]
MLDKPEIEEMLTGTMQIDPDEHSNVGMNPGLLTSTIYAMAGLLYLFRRESGFRRAVFVSASVLTLALLVTVPLLDFVILILASGLVLVSEVLNSAIEAAVDIAAPDYHPMAKVSKDVAATATFLSSIIATIITLLLLLPVLIARISGG